MGATVGQWQHTCFPPLRLVVQTSDFMWKSLQYRTLTNCIYWFPLHTKLPVVIWPVQCWRRRKTPNKQRKYHCYIQSHWNGIGGNCLPQNDEMEWLQACHPLSLLLQTDRKGHRFQPLIYLITNMINRIEIILKLYGSGSKVLGTLCWVGIDWIRLDGSYSAPKCCIWIFPPSVSNFETFPPRSFPTLKSRSLCQHSLNMKPGPRSLPLL